jgi:hypothetical protein
MRTVMKTARIAGKDFRSAIAKIGSALAYASVILGVLIEPTVAADNDQQNRERYEREHRDHDRDRDRDWRRDQGYYGYYGNSYGPDYDYSPPYYYSSPGIGISSPGINIYVPFGSHRR